MLGIVISDDDRYTLELSAEMVNECIRAYGLPAEVLCVTTNYHEINVFLNRNRGAYLYFLDIDFGGEKLNGIDIARNIKKLEPLSKIAFVTANSDFGLKVLKSGVEPFGFIEKRFHHESMAADYRKYIELALHSPHMEQAESKARTAASVKLPVGIDEYIDLDVSRILYVEAVKTISHFVCYHSLDGSAISVRDTIENVLTKLLELSSAFMKSHRAVIINTTYVVSVSDGFVNFSNGESAACSFRLKNEVIKRCIK